MKDLMNYLDISPLKVQGHISHAMDDEGKLRINVKKSKPLGNNVGGPRLSKVNSISVVSHLRPNHWTHINDEVLETVSRNKVCESLKQFKELYTNLLQKRKSGGRVKGKTTYQAHIVAAMILKKDGKWVNCDEEVGRVPGVEIGDQFQFRAELALVGLPKQLNNGISYIKFGEKFYATSIVNSGRYNNVRVSNTEFIYTGEGGNPKVSKKKPIDQDLKGGNLALKTNMEAKLPVRVIHYCACLNTCSTLGLNIGSGQKYLYDGLYFVSSCRQERDDYGKLVFKFKMIRMANQKNLGCQLPYEVRKSNLEKQHGIKASIYKRENLGHLFD